MPFIYKYQVDGAGNYVLDGGNKVILESYEYGEGAGLDWRRIASSTKKPPYVRSFQVRKFNNGDTWVLIINQKQLVGIYPSQDAALQILNGLFTRVSANDESARAVMSHQLSKGGSSVDPAFNNLTLARSGNDLVITLSLINTTDPAIATPIVTWDDYTNPGSPGQKTTVGSVTEPEGGTQIFTIVGGWNTAVENNYIQAFLEDSGVGVSVSSNVILKDEVDPSGTLSVLIQNLAGDGPPEATTDGNTYTGAAYATPSWTVEDWPVGVTPSYSYAWAYEVDGGGLTAVGGSGSTLDLALVPYGATITVGAVATAFVNGKVVDSASPAPQVAVAVSDPAGVDVVDIRLFTDAARTNNVTSNPPGNTLLYAYAYGDVNDPDSSPIINATYFDGQGVVASFSGTPTPSEVNAADGTVLSVTDVGVAGTDTPTVTYAWSTGATTPTLDTTGLEGTAITCTVTASNQWTPDATAFVDFGTVTAVPEDWDTNADGIWATPSATNDPADSQELIASVNYLTTASGGFHGWYRDGTEPASRYWNTLGGDTPPPYTAVWNETDGVWHGWSGHGTLTNIANETIRWNDAGANLWSFAHQGDVLVVVYLSQAPTNFANWRDYDGPLPTDWDTAPNRGYTAAGNTVAPVGTDGTKGVAVEYIVGAGTFDTYAMTSGNSIEASAMRWASAANLSIKMTNTVDTDPFSADYPYLAFWSSAANKWRKGTAQARGNFKTDMIYSMTPADMTWNQSDVPPQAVLFFTADPGDVSTWRPYDGPTGPAILQEAVYSYDATGTEISYTTTGPKEVVYNNAAQTNPPRWIFGSTLQTDHPTLFDQYLYDRYYANTLADALTFVNFYDLVFTCEYNDGTTHTYTVPGTYYNTSVSPSQAFYNNMEIYGQNGIDFALARTPPTNQTSTVTIQVYNVGEAP